MHDQFKQLIIRKFGTERGYVSNAATKLQINQGNLSAMMRGRISIPQKYIDALNAMPDFAPPSGIKLEIDHDTNQLNSYFTVRLTPQAAKDLEFIARFHTRGHQMPDFTADEDATSRMFEDILSDSKDVIFKCAPTAYFAVERVIAAERDEQRRQLNLELNERKHLVADELTENEILDGGDEDEDEDPLA